MASAAAPPPASAADALEVVLARLRYANAADPAAMAAGEQARCLKLLEQVHAMGTAAHASVLGAFTAGQGYTEDGEYSPRSWLIHQADVTRAAAFAYTAWARRAQEHPKIRQAMAGGIVSESWARALCEITGKIPQPGDRRRRRRLAGGPDRPGRRLRRHPGPGGHRRHRPRRPRRPGPALRRTAPARPQRPHPVRGRPARRSVCR
jgi:hypothetical protein